MKQKTLDDLEPVLEPKLLTAEPLTNPNKVKPRSRNALQVYDSLQELRLVEEDPLY